MASLHKDPRGKSPFWYCAYRTADGRRVFKSTKQKIHKKALEVCLNLERAEIEAAEGQLTETRARELIGDTVERVTGKRLEFSTLRDWAAKWLAGKEAASDLSENSKIAYRHALRLFTEHLGKKADGNIAGITANDVQDFKMARMEDGITAKTLDRDLKIIRSVFKTARVYGLINYDPAQAVPLLTRKSKRKVQAISKETFTAAELEAITAKAESDWKTVILLARYTGARLGDCIRMNWENVDLEKNIIEYSDRKTHKDYKVPIHRKLEKHLLNLADSDDPRGFLAPSLAHKGTGGKTGLSNLFRRIMAKAGVDDRLVKTKAAKATASTGRTLARRSFHSIRHSYNSELANAGTSQEIRRKLIGHASDDMNDVYTHLDMKVFRQAISKLR